MPSLTYSAGGVVLNKRREILVVNQHGNSWSLPKGHIDKGEDAVAAARREIFEESGVHRLRLVKALGGYRRHRIGKYGGEDRSELKQIDFFLFRTPQMRLLPRDKDNPEARWVPPRDAARLLTHPKDRRFLSAVLRRLKRDLTPKQSLRHASGRGPDA
jgi:8-oxo-dGTP pyrophosphatase MutT (NUDIX family)